MKCAGCGINDYALSGLMSGDRRRNMGLHPMLKDYALSGLTIIFVVKSTHWHSELNDIDHSSPERVPHISGPEVM